MSADGMVELDELLKTLENEEIPRRKATLAVERLLLVGDGWPKPSFEITEVERIRHTEV